MFEMTLTDRPGHIERLTQNDLKLRSRAAKLDELQLKTLHFTGLNTDLTIGLSPRAHWLGGSKVAHGKHERRHTPNAPTYEVYTTPDWRTVSGTVRLTKEIVIDGSVIEEGQLTFEAGRVTKVAAKTGQEILEEMVHSDEGAAQLGEVALVGLDSPIAKQGRVFRANVPDENAACHIALGASFLAAIHDGDSLSKAEATKLGCNVSALHHDVMISDFDTTVTATGYDGQTYTLIEGGHWTPEFA